MDKRSFFSLNMGILAGWVMAICGAAIIFVSGLMGAPTSMGYAQFGGDAFSYISNHTYYTASLLHMLINCFGLFMILFGIMAICFFKSKKDAAKLEDAKREETAEKIVASQPQPQPQSHPAFQNPYAQMMPTSSQLPNGHPANNQPPNAYTAGSQPNLYSQ